MSRSGAWSDYGATIIIDSTLNYRYFDENKKQGYTGRIDEKFFDTLNRKFESIKFKTMPTWGYHGCKDCEVFELIVHWRDKKRRIIKDWPIEVDSTLKVLLWLNDSYKYVKLAPTNTVFQFETSFPKESTKAPAYSVAFPPPITKPSKKLQHKILTQ
ncbi:hypothetical protein [Mucilaginibacter gotjawali]|uniref:hypothetical protein n=1 Tax=Mucilaginibacter gotjawali TaxID=1550579 RepID=UPI0012FE3936|nr:hypothetical protein [Mucilaginibacter gotjawali]